MATIRQIDELLELRDAAFVECAYQVLLGRAPDPGGADFYLARLRNGIDKLRILREIRRSSEGRSRSVSIAGLEAAIRHQEQLDASRVGRLLQALGYAKRGRPAPQIVRLVGSALFPLNVAADLINDSPLSAQTGAAPHTQELVRQLRTLAQERRSE